MFDYLQQFNNLSKDLRAKISSPGVMSAISSLEVKYKVELAAFVMKVMVKKYSANKLAFFLMSDLKMNSDKAKLLEQELLEKVLFEVRDYLEISNSEKLDNKDVDKKEMDKDKIGEDLKSREHETKENKKLFFQKTEKLSKIEAPDKTLFLDNAKDDIKKLESENKKQLLDVGNKEEIKTEVSQKMEENKEIELVKKHNLSIDNQVREAITNSLINLSSSHLSDRLFLTLKTYLKGIRDKVSTRSVLVRATSDGGLGLDNISVDKLFKNLDKFKLNTENNFIMTKPPLSSSLEKKQIEEHLKSINDSYDLKKSIATKQGLDDKNNDQNDLITNKVEKKEVPNPLTLNHNEEEKKVEFKPVKKETEKETEKEEKSEKIKDKKRNIFNFSKKDEEIKTLEINDKNSNSKDLIKSKEEDISISKEIEPQIDKSKFQPKLNPSKPRLDDIRMVNKIMGPVDELRYIDIVNFRRLAKSTDEAISKIKIKLNLLEKSSYEKMILGIEAWRKNPLNQLYRDITIESINQGKPIPEIIKQREAEKKDVLTVEEFKALINFNREITF